MFIIYKLSGWVPPIWLGVKYLSVYVFVIINGHSCSLFFRTRAPYGEKKEKFVYALSLVFVQCIVNALFAEAGMLTRVNLLENYQPEC